MFSEDKDMDLITLASAFGGVLTALGVKELIMWFLNRKSNSRIASSQADIAELKADSDEYHLLRERLEVADTHNLELQKKLYDKEERFHEQTLLVRDLQKQLLEKTQENGELKAEISALKAERKMKLCERRGCADRQPQSGY